jgi:hypothetical protein
MDANCLLLIKIFIGGNCSVLISAACSTLEMQLNATRFLKLSLAVLKPLSRSRRWCLSYVGLFTKYEDSWLGLTLGMLLAPKFEFLRRLKNSVGLK